jgi:hypothetical protein
MKLPRTLPLIALLIGSWQPVLAQDLFRRSFERVVPVPRQEVDPGAVLGSGARQQLPHRDPRTDQEVDPGNVLPPTTTPGVPGSPEQPARGAILPEKRSDVGIQPTDVLGTLPRTIGRGFESDQVRVPVSNTSCTSEKMPFALLRSIVFYVRSKDGLACSQAVRTIQSLKQTYGTDSYATLKDPTYLADRNHFMERQMVENYVNDCSKTLQEGAVSQLLTLDNQIKAVKNIGVLTTPAQRCMGSIVKGRVLTARHCVVVPESEDGNHPLIQPDTALDFETLSGDKYSLNFEGSDKSALQETGRDKDWITLGIKGWVQNTATTELAYNPGLAQIWRPLVLISMSPYAMALRNDFRSNAQNAVIDISPICGILARDGGYIFHACQTLAGMSGAPLLTIEDDRLTVVGVHTGDSSSVKTPCAESVASRFANYGVVPADDIGGTR